MKIGLFYSSDTGNTECVAELMRDEIGEEIMDIHEVFKTDLQDTIIQYDFIILGVPTWYDGEMQSEWANKLDDLAKVDLSNRKVAIYGLGEQEDWGEYFCDAMMPLALKAQESGATIIGNWPSVGYEFTDSKALIDEHTFIGLPLDEDRQADLTVSRIKTWLKLLLAELAVDNWRASLI
ncbi:flavodoxin [Methyloprofundus sp.]|uniref:flavodoxin n=1 Tax=Methyloprofundus sp. TaxID=2020875 RepID=UPI003D0D45BA